jgi:hypothetical protein
VSKGHIHRLFMVMYWYTGDKVFAGVLVRFGVFWLVLVVFRSSFGGVSVMFWCGSGWWKLRCPGKPVFIRLMLVVIVFQRGWACIVPLK